MGGRLNMYLCLCHGISDKQITMWMEKRNISKVRDIQQLCKAGTSCGTCVFAIKEFIQNKKSQGSCQLQNKESNSKETEQDAS